MQLTHYIAVTIANMHPAHRACALDVANALETLKYLSPCRVLVHIDEVDGWFDELTAHGVNPVALRKLIRYLNRKHVEFLMVNYVDSTNHSEV